MRNIAPLENSLHNLQLLLGFRTYTLVVVGAGLALVTLVCGLLWALFPKYASFVLKNLSRNKLRTMLSGMAIMVLALVVTLVWSILVPLDAFMTEKTTDFKVVVSERWKVPSQMPFAYATTLEEGAYSQPGDVRVESGNSMTWTFYGGTVDKEKGAIPAGVAGRGGADGFKGGGGLSDSNLRGRDVQGGMPWIRTASWNVRQRMAGSYLQ